MGGVLMPRLFSAGSLYADTADTADQQVSGRAALGLVWATPR